MTIKYVMVGYGRMGRLHVDTLAQLGAHLVAVVDPRLPAGTVDGVPALASIAQAARLRPDFWDVCAATSAHGGILAEVAAADPRADVLTEKPLCDPADVAPVRRVLGSHRGRIVVNENYRSSAVTAEVATVMRTFGLHVERVRVEMTKDRRTDVAAGRFQDLVLGAFGYEGPHLVAVLSELGRGTGLDLWPGGRARVGLHGRRTAGGPPQDGGEVGYRSRSGCRVDLYTSLVGRVRYCRSVLTPAAPSPSVRHRLVAVDGRDAAGVRWQVRGWYEPVLGLPRRCGRVEVQRVGGPPQVDRVIEDDSLGRHQRRVLRHFSGQGPNPGPPALALAELALLHEWAAGAGGTREGMLVSPHVPRTEQPVEPTAEPATPAAPRTEGGPL